MSANGVVGDRCWAVCDGHTGLIASAKRPRLWASLLSCTARYEDSVASPRGHIYLPSGAHLTSDSADVHAALSAFVARPVRLVTAVAEPSIEVLASDNGLSNDPAGNALIWCGRE